MMEGHEKRALKTQDALFRGRIGAEQSGERFDGRVRPKMSSGFVRVNRGDILESSES